jgi:hypothetical protein
MLSLSRPQVVFHSRSSCVSPVELTEGRGVGEGARAGRGAELYDCEKADPLKIDASTKRPLPVLILPFKTSLNDFISDNHEF